MTIEIKKTESVADLPEMQNAAAQFGQVYYCRHMFPGLCGYENEDVLIDADTMKKMLPSMVGKPIYVDHQTVDLSKLPEKADGWVTDTFYNPHDGWGWAKMMVVSNAGNQAIRAGQSVSNAWKPVSWGSSGSFHAIDYNRKIEDAYFTHLAIVRTPRYEQAKIFTPEEFKNYQDEKEKEYKNSKEQQEPKTMKFFTREKKEVLNQADITEDAMVEIEGKEVSLKEMINSVAASEKAKKDAEKTNAAKKNTGSEMLNEDTEVCVGDEKMPMKELMNKYNAMCKKNEADEKEKKEKDEKEAKKNADDEKEKKEKDEKEAKKNAEEKENSRFNEFRNAKDIGGFQNEATVQLRMDGVARGKQAYGAQDVAKKA